MPRAMARVDRRDLVTATVRAAPKRRPLTLLDGGALVRVVHDFFHARRVLAIRFSKKYQNHHNA